MAVSNCDSLSSQRPLCPHNPPKVKAKEHTVVERKVQQIHMDVLVSVTETTTLDSEVKASIKVLGANVNGKSEGNTVNSNRVSFDIPVCLPVKN